MYCPKCGTPLKEKANFCSNCGNNCCSSHTNSSSSTISPKSSFNLSLIFGIIALCSFIIPIISLPFAITSIVLGHQEQKQTNKTTTGTILGVISLILNILEIIIFIIFIVNVKNLSSTLIEEFSSSSDSTNNFYDYYEQMESFDIKGHSWLANDNSTLYLNNDYSYTWYQDDQNHTDNYYLGTYQYYTGEDAISYISTYLKQYGLTEEEQRSLFQNGTYQLKNYYLIILNCNQVIINQTEQTPELTTVYYYGFYNEQSQKLDLVNMDTATSASFTLQDTISQIDI